jgi:hypothetical protein
LRFRTFSQFVDERKARNNPLSSLTRNCAESTQVVADAPLGSTHKYTTEVIQEDADFLLTPMVAAGGFRILKDGDNGLR